MQGSGQGGTPHSVPGFAIRRSGCGLYLQFHGQQPISGLGGLVRFSQWPVLPFGRINGHVRFSLPNLSVWRGL